MLVVLSDRVVVEVVEVLVVMNVVVGGVVILAKVTVVVD